MTVRIVTNAYWATSYKKASSVIQKLYTSGLREINYSTGDEHQKWVPYDNIAYAILATMDTDLTCIINIESHDNSSFLCEKLIRDDRLSKYLDPFEKGPKLQIKNGVWVSLNKKEDLSYKKFTIDKNTTGCKSLFSTISINPYSNLLACCGLFCENISCFRLGNLKQRNLKEMYESQFNDFMKIWLYVEGPYTILEYVSKKRGLTIRKNILHDCSFCAEIFKDSENINCIIKNRKEIIPRVMLKYNLLIK